MHFTFMCASRCSHRGVAAAVALASKPHQNSLPQSVVATLTSVGQANISIMFQRMAAFARQRHIRLCQAKKKTRTDGPFPLKSFVF